MRFMTTMRDLLIKALAEAYREQFAIQWGRGEPHPHFYDQRMAWFDMGFTDRHFGADVFTRGFFSALAVDEGDLVLDIGCGDGFFTSRFLATKAREAHGLDSDPEAIAAATADNAKDNVRYLLADAAKNDFPAARYDVIAWNGSIGHFRRDEALAVLAKIAAALDPEGLFVGSESLGAEGVQDHHLFFSDQEDVRDLLGRHFPHVAVTTRAYAIGGGCLRKEAYWRCSFGTKRLRRLAWDISKTEK